jgi:hypothetical protein
MASMQVVADVAPLAQSVARMHSGAASPGVTQTLPKQTLASLQQQSADVLQTSRHSLPTHIFPAPQSELVPQVAWGAWSG